MLHNLESQGMFIKMNNITYALRKKKPKTNGIFVWNRLLLWDVA